MADYLKQPILRQPRTIAQLGQENGGANYFGEPGMPPIAQGPTDEQNAQFLRNSAEGLLRDAPAAAPYQAPNYNSGNYALPNDYQIGYNQNYSNPNDPTSTAFALQQNIKSLATGAASAKQNQKFQKGQHAQDLVRNFLAPLAATFGPNGAAQGVNEYMKTSNERAVKAKEMNLKEQADAITQMKTMADMLKDNNPYTKDQLEQIVKRAKAEQEIRSEQALQAQREQAAKTDALKGAENRAGVVEKVSNIFKNVATGGLTGQKEKTEVLKGEKTEAQTATEKEKANTQAAATGLKNNQAGLAASKTKETDAKTAQVAPLAASKIALEGQRQATSKAQELLAGAHKRAVAQGYHDGAINDADMVKFEETAPPGFGSGNPVIKQMIEAAAKKRGGKPTQLDLATIQAMARGAHERQVAAMKGKGKGNGPPAPDMNRFKKGPRL